MRTKKAFYILISNLTFQMINVLIGLILPRLFITAFGSAVNGLILSIRQFLSFLNIVEAGIGLASITALLKPIAADDKAAANGILSATKILYMRTGYIFSCLIALLAIIYPFIADEEISYYTSFFLVIILGFSGFIDFFILGKYRVLLTADQRGYVITNIQIIGLIINAISYVILIKWGWNLLLVNGIATILFVSRSVLLIRYVKRNYSHVNFNEKIHTFKLDQRWDVLIHQIAGVIVFNSPVIIIAVFLGLKEVSVYTTYNMVFAGVTMLLTSFSGAMFAGIGDLLARGEKHKVLEIYQIFEFVYYAIIAWAYTIAFILILPFIKIYTQGVHDAEYMRPSLAILFVIVGVANNIRIPPNTLVNSAGHFKETKSRAIAETCINLAGSLIFVQIFGTEGVLLGAVCSFAYRTIDFIYYASRKLLEASLKPTFNKIMLNFFLAIIAVLPIRWYFDINPKNLYEWFFDAVIVGFLTLCVIIFGNIIAYPKLCKSLFIKVKLVLTRKSGVKLNY